jgi:uncharacterized protein YqgC (DUF456 family)
VTGTEILVAAAMVVGLAGIVVPVLPGSVLILVALLVWAGEQGSATAWAVAAAGSLVLVVGGVVKYALPGRRLTASGVPRRTLVAGGLLGTVGFFVVPVVGLFLGFVLGVYLSEAQRLGGQQAWASTRAALKAVGVSILIELAAALVAVSCWVVGVALT